MSFVRALILAVSLLSLSAAVPFNPSNTEVMKENIPLNGTMGRGSTVTIEMEGVSDLRYYIVGIKLDASDATVGVKIGEATVVCGSTDKFSIENGIASTRYSSTRVCEEGKLRIEIKNLHNSDVKYWAITARIENAMYDFELDVPKAAVLPGHSTYEVITYRGYIGEDSGASGAVDFVNITVHYDVFASSTVKAYVGESPNPTSRTMKQLENVGDHLFLALGRNDKLFCHECYRYVLVFIEKAADEPVYFSAKFHVDRGIVHLVNNEMVTKEVMPDTHVQDFLIDLREMEYEAGIYLGFQKLNEPTVDLQVDVAHTSFDDGEEDVIKSTTLYGMALREWGINTSDRGFVVGGVYYIRVSDKSESSVPLKFTMVYRILRVQSNYLYTGKKHHMVSTNERVSLNYYRINIPKEEFVDVQALTIRMTNVEYTYNKGPVYAFGFHTYYGKQSDVVTINNPRDPSTYSYTTYEQYKREIEFVITEDEEGFCVDCTYGFSIRTTNETHWTIGAELTYAPFMLRPNVARRGSLMPFTGGIETFFYLHQDSYVPVEIAVSRLGEEDPHVVLFVSTTPHASMDNHYWTDTTQADNRAEIELTHDHPNYCTDCFYYITVMYLHPETETDSTQLEIVVNCEGEACASCEEGFDPSTGCTTCLAGYYGNSCKQCKACNHGYCDDGLTGSGKCLCDEGWGPDEVCNTCAEGFWGAQCEECPNCHGHGECLDGRTGSGKCDCVGKWDSINNCEDCKSGYWGSECKGECPANAEGVVCSGHGECDDGVFGTGRCLCKSGYVGIKCDTLYENDKCNPHCKEGQGACDEETGKCICYDGFIGKDCAYSSSTVLMIIAGVVVAVVVVVMIIFTIFYSRKKNGRLFKSKATTMPTTSQEYGSLLNEAV